MDKNRLYFFTKFFTKMGRAKKLEVLNVAAFAALIGVTGPAVNKMITAGKITDRSIQMSKANKPQIIVEYAVEDLAKNETPGAVRKTKGGLNMGGNTKPAQKVKPDINKDDIEKLISTAKVNPDGKIEVKGIDMATDPEDFYAAKVREQIGKAVKLELEIAEKRSQLVDKREQDMQLRDLGVTLKTDLGTVADRVAANCFAAESVLEVRNVIYGAIEQVLLKYSGKVWN